MNKYFNDVHILTAENIVTVSRQHCVNLLFKSFYHSLLKQDTIAGGIKGRKRASENNLRVAQFNHISAIALDNAGCIYVSDHYNNVIRKLDVKLQKEYLVAGTGKAGFVDGPASKSELECPRGLAFNKTYDTLYFCDYNNYCIRKMDFKTDTVSLVAGTPFESGSTDGGIRHGKFTSPWGIQCTSNEDLIVTDRSTASIRKVSPNGTITTIITTIAPRCSIYSCMLHPEDEGILFASANHSILKINLKTQSVMTIAGSTESGYKNHVIPLKARFSFPYGLCLYNNHLYVADSCNQRIRKVDLITEEVSTFAGNGDIGGEDSTLLHSSYTYPCDMIGDERNECLYIIDELAVRRIKLPKSGLQLL